MDDKITITKKEYEELLQIKKDKEISDQVLEYLSSGIENTLKKYEDLK
jgi:hypothetical protein